jgi:universal stress protein A
MASRRTSPASGAPDAIGRLTAAAGADLIVIGRHGHPGVERLPGSTAEKLIGHAECPVLVVRN